MNPAERLLSIHPGIKARLIVAHQHIEERRYDQAIEELRIALDRDPEVALSHLLLGKLYLLTGRLAESIIEIKKALTHRVGAFSCLERSTDGVEPALPHPFFRIEC